MSNYRLFNPSASDKKTERKLFHGKTSGIIDLNNVKYQWGVQLYNQMREYFWIPQKFDLTDDVTCYKELTEPERNAYKGILSYLVYLDSIQVNNVPFLMQYITAPEIKICLAEQVSQETMHSASYANMIETVLPASERDLVYHYWRKNKPLYERCKLIGEYYQNALDFPSEDNITIAFVSDYLLEGLYFYMGFLFFYNLSSRNLMNSTVDHIRLINRDELSHLRLYQKIVAERLNTTPNALESIYRLFETAVKKEIEWNCEIIGDEILGLTTNSIIDYIHYLANIRLKAIGLEDLFPPKKNPFKHLEKLADTSADANVKSNFFDGSVTSYNMSSALEGFEEF